MATTIRPGQFKNFDEEVEDAVGTSISGVGGITVIYDDESDIILISGSEYTTESWVNDNFISNGEMTTISGDIIDYVDVVDGVLTTAVNGRKRYHGVQAMGALSFDNSSHVVTAASGTNIYWYKGTQYTVSAAITCDLDDYVTLTAYTIYYVYFDDTSGTLKASTAFWDLHEKVSVATVYWNGSAGALSKETHSHTRNIDWHINAHLTIGSRYYNGLSQTAPTTAADASLQIETGIIYDEDLATTIAQQTISRIWYLVSANTYTFADSTLPYAGTSGAPKYLDTDTYTLTSPSSGDYAVMWVYASTDVSRPIYIFPHAAATDYANLTAARAATPPALVGMGLTPELKLIYKWIYTDTGQYIEGVDYRNSSSLPAGGVASTSAAAVTFVPYGDVASTNVQTAVQELDDEKLSITQFTTSSGDIVSQIPTDYVSDSEITTISGDIVSQIITDHGTLTGLSDDDHTQYILVNGDRGFTDTVSGVYPTQDAHLATKEYVDDAVSSSGSSSSITYLVASHSAERGRNGGGGSSGGWITRPISLYYRNSPPTFDTNYVKATTYYSATYAPWKPPDGSLALTGTAAGTEWFTTDGVVTNQRYHVDLGSAKIIKAVYYENAHGSGADTNTGVKNFTMQGSNDAGAFAELTYSVDTNWTTLSTSVSQFDQHTASNVEDPKYFTVTNSTAYRYYAFKFADNWGHAVNMRLRRIVLMTDCPNTISGASLAEDTHRLTLPAGTYLVNGYSHHWYTNKVQSRLYDITNSGTLVLGSASFTNSASNYCVTSSHIIGQFVLTGSTVLEFQNRFETSSTSTGFGIAASFEDEIFASVLIQKL